MTGKEVERQPRENIFDLGADLLNLKRTRVSRNLVDRELVRLGLTRGKMRDSVTLEGQTVDLDNEQYFKLRKIIQEDFRFDEVLENLISSDEYRNPNRSNEYRRLLIQSYFSNYQNAAREKLNGESQEIIDEILDGRLEEARELLKPSGPISTETLGDILN